MSKGYNNWGYNNNCGCDIKPSCECCQCCCQCFEKKEEPKEKCATIKVCIEEEKKDDCCC